MLAPSIAGRYVLLRYFFIALSKYLEIMRGKCKKAVRPHEKNTFQCRMLFVLTLPPQALTRAGFKGISQLHKQSLISTPGELNSKNMITLFIELSKVKYSHSEYLAYHFSKTNLKTAKSLKPVKIKGLIDDTFGTNVRI